MIPKRLDFSTPQEEVQKLQLRILMRAQVCLALLLKMLICFKGNGIFQAFLSEDYEHCYVLDKKNTIRRIQTRDMKIIASKSLDACIPSTLDSTENTTSTHGDITAAMLQNTNFVIGTSCTFF